MTGIERWRGRVAVVTGSSSGIGAATAIELCKNGFITVALARRVERILELGNHLSDEERKNFHAMRCDVSKEEDIVRVFKEIVAKFGGIDVLINNAGILREGKTIDNDNSEKMRSVIDTNLMGLVFCTREAVKSIKERNVDGHIIHINSIAGHFLPYHHGEGMSYGIYSVSKFAVTAMAEQHRQEFMRDKLNIKVTSLSPGAVKTEIIGEASGGELSPKAALEMWNGFPHLLSKDIADSIIYLLGTPPHVLICELLIRPMNEAF